MATTVHRIVKWKNICVRVYGWPWTVASRGRSSKERGASKAHTEANITSVLKITHEE